MAWALAQSPGLSKLWAAPGSDGMSPLAERVPVDPLDPAAVTRFCREKAVELLVIGPEDPLAAGVADAVRASGGTPFFISAKPVPSLVSSFTFPSMSGTIT